MRLTIISDTHVPAFARELPPALFPAFRRCDAILHAGDVTSVELLEELSSFAPVHVAAGNNDAPGVRAWGARDEVQVTVEGARIALVHDAGPRPGRERRLRRRFPETDMVVFGHSHVPLRTRFEGLHLLNPGSPTWKRRQPRPTYATATITDGRIRSRIIEI